MDKIGLFYGSTMGDTKEVAEMIVNIIGKDQVEIYDVAVASQEDLEQYDNLILGASTWGLGELQEDWKSFISQVEAMDFNNKQVALFGLGNQSVYPDTFVDAIGIIYQTIKENGANIIGKVELTGYNFSDSAAVIDNQFVGLALDNKNQSNLTESRIQDWVENLANKF